MYLQGIEILSGFTANEFGIKVRYQPSGTKTKMGKEGLKLLLDVKSEVLERVDVCHPTVSISEDKAIVEVSNGDIWPKDNVHMDDFTKMGRTNYRSCIPQSLLKSGTIT